MSFFDYLKEEHERGKRHLGRQKQMAEQLLRGENITPQQVEQSPEAPLLSQRGMARLIGRGGTEALPALGASLGGAGVGALGGPIGAAIGSATAGGSVAAAQSYLDAYNEALLTGKSPEEADSYAKKTAGISGSATALLSSVPFLGRAGQTIGKEILKQGAIQAGGAATEQVARNALERSEINPERGLLEGAGEAALGNTLMSTPLIAAGQVSKSWKKGVGDIPHPEVVEPEIKADLNQEVLSRTQELLFAPPEAPKNMFDSLSMEKISHLSDEVQDGIFDSFHGIRKMTPIREADNKAYRMARFSRHFDGIFSACLEEGSPVWNAGEGIIEMKPGSEGLKNIISPVLTSAEQKKNFETYAYARRVKGQGLIEKGKERNITPEMVDNAVRLENAYPEFKDTFNKLQEYNRSVLDLAEETGIIDPQKRALWEQDNYIPFYRDISLESEILKTPQHMKEPSRRLAGQEHKIHELTGGGQYAIYDESGNYVERSLHPSTKEGYASQWVGHRPSDLTGNILKNTSDLLQRSLRNAAAEEAVSQAVKGNIAQKISKKDAHFDGKLKNDVVRVKKGGKDTWYQIEDDLLYRAINSAGSPPKVLSAGTNLLSRWSKIYSGSIMMTPKTMIKVAVKDLMLSRMLGRDVTVPFRQSLSNIKAAYEHVFTGDKDSRLQAMMAMGAGDTFQTGGHERVLKQINRDLEKHNAVTLYGKQAAQFWEKYKDLGKAGELSSRLNRYDSAKKSGLSNAAAGFEALDYMDYRQRGSWDFIQMSTQITPFMASHLASLHKVGRELSHTKWYKNRTVRAVGAVGAFSALNTMMNLKEGDANDAEGYRSLPDYIKYSNMCIDLHQYIGRKAVEAYGLPRHLLIPKPWEIGQLAMGVPEQFVRTLMNDQGWKENMHYIVDTIKDTFAIKPIVGHPLIQTATEAWANKRTFTGAPIVPHRYENMPQEVKTPYQLDHVFTGLLGPLYSLPMALFHPEKDWKETIKNIADVRDIFRVSGPLKRTKQEGEFYDLYREINETSNYINAVRRGVFSPSPERAKELAEKTPQIKETKRKFKLYRDKLKTLDKNIKIFHDQSRPSEEEEMRKQKNQFLFNIMDNAKK